MIVVAVALAAVLPLAEPLPTRTEVDRLIDQAQTWSLAQAQPDGPLLAAKTFRLGITAFAAVALASQPRAVPAARLAPAVRYITGFKQPDGGVYDPGEGLGVYGTSLALLLHARLPADARQTLDAEAMRRYLFGAQNTEPGTQGQGGIGYGDKGAGFEDLSNTGYALQALRASGVSADDQRMQAALAFLERCQDLSTVNKAPWVGNSGGGVYGPQDAVRSWAKGDETQASRWTPSGTMTYELLSSYLVLDLKPGDPRVQAALGWMAKNYGFDANPGMGPGKERQGLFHSYALAGTTFDLLADAKLELPGDWRADLYAALAKRAKRAPTGGAFWVNDASRWGEGMPELCTAYAIRALKAVAKALPEP